MELWIVDSYTKVFKDSIKPNHSLETIKFDCAKNEYESAQIVLKGNEDFTIHGVDFSDLSNLKHVISNKHLKYNYQDFIVFNDGIHYPDPLLNSTSIHVLKNESQSIWVTCFIPKETPAGDYKGMVTIHTSRGDFDVEIEMTVYSVTIPVPKAGELSLEYWTFFVGSWYHSYDSFNVIEKQYGYKKYSREWWDLLEHAIDHMKEHRINTILVRTQDLLLDAGTTIDDKGKYTFNWGLFDQYIERFMNKDMVK